MRLSSPLCVLATCLTALVAAGCGAGSGANQPSVAVTITAPTSGATLGVHRVVVTGVVSPADAAVRVGDQAAQVSGGRFTSSLWLNTPTQVVSVTAQARGYAPGRAAATINYSPNLAAQITASTNAFSNHPASTGTTAQTSLTPAASAALSAALAPPAPTAKPTGTTPTTTGSPTSSPPSPGGSSSSGGSSGSGTATGAPVTLVPTIQQIKQGWESGCLVGVKSDVHPWCTCIYNHLSATGTFDSVPAVNALLKELHDFARTGDLNVLSKPVKQALTACASQLPALAPLTGTPTLTKLPSSSHQPASSPTTTVPLPTTTVPAPSSTPTVTPPGG